jgi:hypothetical protein
MTKKTPKNAVAALLYALPNQKRDSTHSTKVEKRDVAVPSDT